ncbi:hypothetical protein AVEN_22434-1 [Araneus ventricosus]|uniref:Uncharacterized protein n=1 Tax=Araneus ventricosus TaxID=182803 RepID=A0A4Y2UR89_ARAVE|nr:hypothetical protein AVEN_22434-1 [Araneus ventricosus]
MVLVSAIFVHVTPSMKGMGYGDLVVWSRLQNRGVPGSKPDSTKDQSVTQWPQWPSGKVSALGQEGSSFETRFPAEVWGLSHVKSYVLQLV